MELAESTYCRLCADLTPTSKMFDLFSDKVRCREVVEKLTILKREFVNIFRDSNLPKTVCYLCLDSLYRAVAFVERVEVSQVTLKDVYIPPQSIEPVWTTSDEPTSDPFEMDEVKSEEENTKKIQSTAVSFSNQTPSETQFSLETHQSSNTLLISTQQSSVKSEIQSQIEILVDAVPESSRKQFESSQYQEEYTRKYEQHIRQIKNGERKSLVKRKRKPLPLPIREISKIVDKSWTGYPWTCELCFSGFSNVYLLREHTKQVHFQCFAMKCVDCLETTDCYISFVYHVRSHRPFLKLYCPYCNFRFDKTNQKEHIRLHFNGPERMCDTCGQIFPNSEERQRHITAYRPPPLRRQASMARLRPTIMDDKTCNICNKVFSTAGSARAHKLIHSERKKEHICEVCGKDFFRKSDLSHHRLIHNSSDPKVCIICKKTFTTLQRLRDHVLTHSKEKPFQCYICKRNFRLKRQMNDHMIIHTGEKPYKCNYCERSFRFKTSLKSHQLQHTGERPFVCQNCGRRFANWSNCNQHMKTRHGTTLAKHVITSEGKVPINPITGRVKKVKPFEAVKEWTEQILESRGRRAEKCKTCRLIPKNCFCSLIVGSLP